MTVDRLVHRRRGIRLLPDPSRVVTRLFVAGQEVVGGSESRASGVVGRILALDEAAVRRRLDDVLSRFDGRHEDLVRTFNEHAERIGNRVEDGVELSQERWLLLGATFTHEYAVEGAALCNPSIVAHPDQSDAPLGGLRVVMSMRCIGEGHRSSIGFRTGAITAEGAMEIDPPGPFPVTNSVHPGVFDRDVFHGRLRVLGKDGESAAFVLDRLGPHFTMAELADRLDLLAAQRDTRRDAIATADRLRAVASCSYSAQFPAESMVSERVLWPAMGAESHGMEDARFVLFTEDDGSTSYYATYTAFDGADITQQLLQTDDFITFESSPVVGPAAQNKGLALFPRRIGGRYAAMSRHDRETNAVTFSDSLGHWDKPVSCQASVHDWEVIQLGNCGSPIETEAGWLLLTHGVGPMRTYSIGALLLDLDDPSRVVASLSEPLLTPAADEQDGYVPNVLYTCGALLHGNVLVIPYGVADQSIGVATAHWPEVLAAMVPA